MWIKKGKKQKEFIERYNSYKMLFDKDSNKETRKIFILSILILFLIILMFLPWTQTIKGSGKVTTLKPNQRPQQINSIIPGKINKWYVKEGDMVNAGDTLLFISEIKDDYLDPNLIERTEEQITTKSGSISYYNSKAGQIDNQMAALIDARALKLSQINNKIQQAKLYIVSDSIALVAAKSELEIASLQYKRQEELYTQGLKSLTELEQRKQKLQDVKAKKTIAENKYINAKNDLINAQLELLAIEKEYSEKIAKVNSDKYSTLSDAINAQGEIAKLSNKKQNYQIRNSFYYITAPQDGQITKTIKAGIGEVIKEGELLIAITPKFIDKAVEMYIEPIDLPLAVIGKKVSLQFDGYPAIVFSGWPNNSYGTFEGVVTSIDNNISENGKFRLLIKEYKNGKPWPDNLKIGAGAIGFALLNDVAIGYEIWRQLNGFPPDFYQPKNQKDDKKK
jgi:adhesin transport system membrane fusion protein